MSRKKHTHLRGERGQAFADKIRGIPLEQILCVSLDIHKYFHVVMIHNALGEIVMTTFEIDIFQAGFDRLNTATTPREKEKKQQAASTLGRIEDRFAVERPLSVFERLLRFFRCSRRCHGCPER